MQLSYTTIRAPISGRISAASVKVGNFVRPADVMPLATINPDRADLRVLRAAAETAAGTARRLMEGNATVDAVVPGEQRRGSVG